MLACRTQHQRNEVDLSKSAGLSHSKKVHLSYCTFRIGLAPWKRASLSFRHHRNSLNNHIRRRLATRFRHLKTAFDHLCHQLGETSSLARLRLLFRTAKSCHSTVLRLSPSRLIFLRFNISFDYLQVTLAVCLSSLALTIF